MILNKVSSQNYILDFQENSIVGVSSAHLSHGHTKIIAPS